MTKNALFPFVVALLLLAAFGLYGTKLANDQLPSVIQATTVTSTDTTVPGQIVMPQRPGTQVTVNAGAVTLSAPAVVTSAYTLVFPTAPPATGQTTLVWSQPDVNGVCTGSWK
jgi:hypothetical protein